MTRVSFTFRGKKIASLRDCAVREYPFSRTRCCEPPIDIYRKGKNPITLAKENTSVSYIFF